MWAIPGLILVASGFADASPPEPPGSARLDAGGLHWSVRPVVRPDIPAVREPGWCRNPVDRFVLAGLEAAGLAPSPEADRRTLIRRLSFDLLGLPPDPDEVARFVADPAPDAWERLVDRMLASPHFGERWAQHWLDIAHYADTHGFERDRRRPHAWRYRDWVIRAFNDDLPYDRFLLHQIAGDVVAPDDPDAVIATGFLAAGPWDFVGNVETQNPALRRATRAGDLDDMLTQVMTATVGMTIHCARCHDHKVDPISQVEYYRLASVFAGATRGDRIVDASEAAGIRSRREGLEAELREVDEAIRRVRGEVFSLADVVGGGDGSGTGEAGAGLDPRTARRRVEPGGFLDGVIVNRFARSVLRFVDGTVIPDGGEDGGARIPVSSTGLAASGLPRTSGMAWDAIRKGPVNAQASTEVGGVDFATDGHSLLGLHANAGITFDLAAVREFAGWTGADLRFSATAGYGGSDAAGRADVHVFVDGVAAFAESGLTRVSGARPIEVALAASARFLTLLATDGGNGISHDQVFFGDPLLERVRRDSGGPEAMTPRSERLAALEVRRRGIAEAIDTLPEPAQVYGVVATEPPPIRLLHRGDPEQPEGDVVTPAALSWVGALPSEFAAAAVDGGEGNRRRALAEWITDPRNPLTRRVIVNRWWHHHFGRGLVATPSDFGRAGGVPSHPELLDWLAEELLAGGWSLKAIHRLIVTSAAYRQSSIADPDRAAHAEALSLDADNRWLWRQNPRRLDAESLRDGVLAVAGTLEREPFGPGFEDFVFTDAYAPIYQYVTADRPELWRRSIYRFVVRTTPNRFLRTLDCPNPATLTPVRAGTTTPVQALALANNEFMLVQARHFAERVAGEAGPEPGRQVARAFERAFQRSPTDEEAAAAAQLVASHGLFHLCRALLNANEFAHVD